MTLNGEQKDRLLAIAKHNEATLAYVIRFAIKQFLTAGPYQQLSLRLPPKGD